MIAVTHFGVSGGFVVRSFGNDVNQSRRGIASKQSALRSAQHFDALELAEFGQAHIIAVTVDAVDEYAHR